MSKTVTTKSALPKKNKLQKKSFQSNREILLQTENFEDIQSGLMKPLKSQKKNRLNYDAIETNDITQQKHGLSKNLSRRTTEKKIKSRKEKDKIKNSFCEAQGTCDSNFSEQDLDQELISVGSKKDKINVLTLIITKNPKKTKKELSDLLDLASISRSEDVFYILQNLKSLIISSSDFISSINDEEKFRITTLFKNHLNNTYIKHKVTSLVFQILNKNMLVDKLLFYFINKLGDHSETKKRVERYLKQLYSKSELRNCINKILMELYDNDFEIRKNIVCFLNEMKIHGIIDTKIYLRFFETTSKSNFKDISTYEKTLDNIMQGLIMSSDIDDLKTISIDKIFHIFNNLNLNLAVLRFLSITENPQFSDYAVKLLSSMVMLDSSKLQYLLFTIRAYILESINPNTAKISIINCLLQCSGFYGTKFTISSLMIASQYLSKHSGIFANEFFQISTYLNHYDPIINVFSQKILKNIKIVSFNPFLDEELHKKYLFYSHI